MQATERQFVPIEEHRALAQECAQLKHRLAQLERMIFGAKSERFVPAASPIQLNLFAPQTELDPPSGVEEEKPKKISYERQAPAKAVKITPHGRSPIPASIPRRTIVIEPAEDTAGLKHIGDEVTEELEFKPGSFYVRRFVRPKYARPEIPHPEITAPDSILIAPLHSRPIEKGIPGAGLLATLLTGKFLDHLPVYRTAQIFERHGVLFPPSTLNDWLHAAIRLLQPLHAALRSEIIASNYLQIDETPIKVLESEIKGKTHRGYLWVCNSPPARLALFEYDPRRSASLPDSLLADFAGNLQSDGYSVYNHFGNKGGILLSGCLSHSRREFEKALDNDRERASTALVKIQALYAVERQAREQNLDPEQRLALRIQVSRPHFDSLLEYLQTEQIKTLPRSAIGSAIAYFLHRRHKLERFLFDGLLEIDNNLVENAIRPVALGRKNYLFAGSHEAAQRIAMMYSFMACCKLNDVNPYDWLRDVLFRAPDQPINRIAELLPHRWKLLDYYPDWWLDDGTESPPRQSSLVQAS